jgi:hypothetical protein
MARESNATRLKTKAHPFVALILAWLIPGAGHVYLGRRTRGIILFITVSALFWAGMGIGGVMTVDPISEPWWFYAEMGTGVQGVFGWYRSKSVHAKVLAEPEVRQFPARSAKWLDAVDAQLAQRKVALTFPEGTVARAYAGVAGLLNLLCIFDALMLAMLGVQGEDPPAVAPDKRGDG